MFKLREISHIALAIIILTFAISFNQLLKNPVKETLLIPSLIFITIIIFFSVFIKKITAHYFESNIETKIWSIKHWGFKPHHHFKNPLPAGIIIPFIVSIISMGYLVWFAVLEFEVNPAVTKVSKRHGNYRLSEMTDIQIGIIAASGVVASLLASIIGYFAGFPEFARLSIYYAAFSLVPISNLDGTKIFFGNRVVWYTLVVITGIFLAYSFLLV